MYAAGVRFRAGTPPDPAARYGQMFRKVAEVATVQDFWSAWAAWPQPSALLTHRMFRKASNGQEGSRSAGLAGFQAPVDWWLFRLVNYETTCRIGRAGWFR